MKSKSSLLILISCGMLLIAGCSSEGAGGSQVDEAEQALIQEGFRVYTTATCNTCHSNDGSTLLAPTFKGILGRETELNDGTKITVDEAYIRESILDSPAKVVKGYQPMHPSFDGILKPEQVDAVGNYIKSLK